MSTYNLSKSKQALLAKFAEGQLQKNKIPKKSDVDSIPLSFAQQRLWFLEQLSPGTSIYNMHDAVKITGKIEPQLLKKVLSRIIHRHEILRTTFPSVDGETMVKIHQPQEIELPIEVVSSEQQAKKIAKEETTRPFDLEKGPLFRVRLIQFNEKKHILLWTMHHIVSDGWSLGLIIKEVMILFDAFSNQLPDPLPELPIQYSDFALWQKKQFQGSQFDKQLSYWRNELSGGFPPLKLPLDYPRPIIPTNRGKRKVATYPSDLMEKLNLLSQKGEATLFMILLAAWNLLLYRYSETNILFVGVPVANRNRAELSDLIGFFANTLVIKAELNPDLQFLDLLAQIKEKSYSAYENQDIPFERLVETLQPQRELNTTPFFQVMFAFQNQPMPSIEQPDLKIEPIEIHNDTCKFDLLLNIYETQFGIEYNADLFHEETIDNILTHYRVLLENIVENPKQTVGEIPIINEAEQLQILQDWNQTKSESTDSNKTLSHYFEKQVSKTPHKIAIVDQGISLTYEELNSRSNELAHRLIDAGVEPDTIVAVYIQRSLEQVISLLAILKAGGTYLPLDEEYPDERISFMVEDSKASILLYKKTLPNWLRKSTYLTIDVTEKNTVSHKKKHIKIKPKPLKKETSKRSVSHTPLLSYAKSTSFTEESSNPSSNANSEHLAYVIYTSGSTGKPNGVMITHRGICNRLLWMQKEFHLTSNDHVLQKTPCSFDVSVWEFFWPLIVGAVLVIAPPKIHRDPLELARCIQQYDITIVHFVPSMLKLFLSKINECNSLRHVFCSGESMPFELASCFLQNSSAKLHNLYGPTEASIDVTFWDCSKKSDKSVIPIGRPISNTQIYILDSKMQPVPIGVYGELYIGGDGLARGYINRPELTEKKFIPNPFDAGKKLYKTNDIARYGKNGAIEFSGRADNQVKIRGVRVELEEIQQSLLTHPEVDEAIVSLHNDVAGNQNLVGYVVPNSMRTDGKERIENWHTVFENTYLNSHGTSPTMNTAGWNSSYTDKPISEEEMKEWVDEKIEIIQKLKPKKILEIGCGTGMLLFRLAKNSELYIGTDISKKALDWISKVLPETTIDSSKVKLFQCSSLDFSSFENETFDLVILNSVVQYFPNLEYFLNVIRKAITVLSEKGSIFLGDLRNFSLMEAFYTSLILDKADDEMTKKELQEKVQQKKDQEQELFLDPELFNQWNIPNISSTTFLQRGSYKNEMTLFRYNTILSREGNLKKKALEDLEQFANIPVDLKEKEHSIKKFLRKTLPECMIPSHICFLETLPLLPNGKIDKQSLTNPVKQQIQSENFPLFQTSTEKAITEVWSNLLGVSSVNSSDNFFDLGGHSLLAAQAALKLSDYLNKEIPLRLIFQFPTASELAKNIEENQETNQGSVTWSTMLKDSFLPASINANETNCQPYANPQKIFLTGATGFLGAYLLRDLLTYTQSKIYCLVRSPDKLSGLYRLKDNLKFYGILEETDLNRVIIVPGTLDEENFGLNKTEYNFLAEEIDAIYHCGAQVHFAASYEELRQTNVLGTAAIFRLAAKEKTKPVHYISTIYTLTNEDNETSNALTEMDYPSEGKTLQMGYLQSKWVAERLAYAARNRKIPVTIYRIGRVSGDTQKGACQKGDFYWGLIRACVKLEKILEGGFDESLIPVDYVSKSIVHLGININNQFSTYHLMNPQKIYGQTVISSLKNAGFILETCSFDEWKKAILNKVQENTDDPAATLAGFLSNRWNEIEPVFSCTNTLKELEKLGIEFPVCDSSWIQKHIDFFTKNRFFPSYTTRS